jgi:hypothetical protein
MVFQPKSNLAGYRLILVRPWLSKCDAHIGCRSRSMTISHGNLNKNITLYPPTKPISDQEIPMWVGDGYNDDEYIQQFIIVDLSFSFKDKIDDYLNCNFIIDPDSHTSVFCYLLAI